MRVIDVLPLSRGVFRESLSYFTGNDSVEVGSIVSVPLRQKEIPALVTSVKDPVQMKSDLRGSEFSLRKIQKVKSKSFLLREFILAAEDTAHYFAGTTGSVLATFIPKVILESPQNGLSLVKGQKEESVALKKIRETSVLQAGDEERFSVYKSLIRERFARGLSVYLCFPTTQEAEELISSLDRGIQEYSFLLHAGLPKNIILSTWKNVLSEKHPVLIIGTGTFLSIPRQDLGAIIIEREASRFYKSSTRPYTDVRVFAEFLAKRRGIELIFGDAALRVETLYKAETNEYAEFGSALKFRSLWGGTYKILDMRAKEGEKSREKFRVLSDELIKIIQEVPQNNERLFIFTGRRGLSPLTVCGDCGTVVNCTRCNAPITLHRGGSSTFFLCHHCGEKRSTEERCRVCNSWKLETLGVGIELVEKAVEKEFPGQALFRLDKDSAKTQKKALDIIAKFYDSPGSILIGTELALYYLKEKVQHSAIVSIDSLFSLPDFRINERIFSMILAIRAKTEKKLLIQTRHIEASVLGYAATGTISDFYREEIEARKLFAYPPFSVLVKISIEGKKEVVEKEIENLEKLFEGYTVDVFPAFIATTKGKHSMNALIKIPRSEWPNATLIEKLKNLPLSFRIEIDPESIF